jgi:hypothetical protein
MTNKMSMTNGLTSLMLRKNLVIVVLRGEEDG